MSSTHDQWVGRMSEWYRGAGPDVEAAAASMDELQRRIDESCERLQGRRAGKAAMSVPCEEIPKQLASQFQEFMTQLKEDLSRDLVRKLEEMGKHEDEKREEVSKRLFEHIDAEKRKLAALEDAVLHSGRRQEPKRSPRDQITAEQQKELLPLLDDIEKAILSMPHPQQQAPPPPPPPCPPPSHPLSQPLDTPPPVPPVPSFPPHYSSPKRGSSKTARFFAKAIERRKQAFDTEMERLSSRTSSASSAAMAPWPGAHDLMSSGSSIQSQQGISRRRQLREPHSLNPTRSQYSQKHCAPFSSHSGLPPPPPPSPPPSSFPVQYYSQAQWYPSNPEYAYDPYEPRDCQHPGYDYDYRDAGWSRHHSVQYPPAPEEPPGFADDDDYHGSNWEVEETELTVY